MLHKIMPAICKLNQFDQVAEKAPVFVFARVVLGERIVPADDAEDRGVDFLAQLRCIDLVEVADCMLDIMPEVPEYKRQFFWIQGVFKPAELLKIGVDRRI